MLANLTCLRIGRRYQQFDDRSRMNREVHVRFWEGVGVKLPRATQLFNSGVQCVERDSSIRINRHDLAVNQLVNGIC